MVLCYLQNQLMFSAVTFYIGSVGDMMWNDAAFESLVLPSDHKELILALTKSQVANKETFDDVIQGKGIPMFQLLLGLYATLTTAVRKGHDNAAEWTTWRG